MASTVRATRSAWRPAPPEVDDGDRGRAHEHEGRAVRGAHRERAPGGGGEGGVRLGAGVLAGAGHHDHAVTVDLAQPRPAVTGAPPRDGSAALVEVAGEVAIGSGRPGEADGALRGDGQLLEERRDVEVVVVAEVEVVVVGVVAEHRGGARAARRPMRAPFLSSQRSKPAAMTVTRTSSPMSSSITVPKMMLASGWATPWMTSAASLTS